MRGFRYFLIGASALVSSLPLAPPAGAARHQAHKSAEQPAKSPPPAGVKLLGTAGAWSAYSSNDSTGRVCYLAGEPGKSRPAGFTRKSPMALVTHRPAENISNVVSLVEGYPLKPGSDLVLDVDGRRFKLFTQDDSAWASTSELDRTIVGALMRAKTATARGEPVRGPATTDTYSLAGFATALEMIDKACGIKRDERPAPAAKVARPTHAAAHRHHHRSHRASHH